jgi:LTXXQ motif family protein
MSHNGNRLVAIVLASILAFVVGADTQARGRRGYFHARHFGHHRFDRRFGQYQLAGSGTTLGTGHFTHKSFRGGFAYGYGWDGPVFWPGAYDDILVDILWGYGLGSPFWDYGYDDIYGGLFSPFGYNDLADYLPAEQSQATASFAVGRTADTRNAGRSSQVSQMCGDDSREVAGWPIERVKQAVSPTAEQRAALDGFADATIRAAQTIKGTCPIDVVFTPTARLQAMQTRIDGMTQAVTIVGPPLNRLYGSLTDEQKARLNTANEQHEHDRGSTAGCNAVGSATRWPAEEIEKAIQPNPEQQGKLGALKMAMAAAADDLADACPSSLPTTPPARLKAISRRLDVMLTAVKKVRAALGDFYSSLGEEQKAEFEALGRQRSRKE